MVLQVISSYFTEIYKRPDHIQGYLAQYAGENVYMADKIIFTTAIFSVEDIRHATLQSNFNKRLGPDFLTGTWSVGMNNWELTPSAISRSLTT
jgi:hypothetical protein